MKNVLANVVMLPTEKASQITTEYINDKDNIFYFPEKVIGKSGENQYLYFTTDEKIKVGDNCIFNLYGSNKLVVIKVNDKFNASYYNEINEQATIVSKIVASTDESLGLPRPSNEFLKAYCEKGGIHQVMIEYVSTQLTKKEDYKYSNGISNLKYIHLPKVAPDNTITIHPVKAKEEKTYTHDEVVAILTNYCHFLNQREGQYLPTIGPLKAWVKENL